MNRKEADDLRAQLQINCPNEPSFNEIYLALGKPRQIAEIQESNKLPKGKTHCKHLRKYPNACNHLPLGDGKFGACKFNPHSRENQEKRDKVRERLKEIGRIEITEEQEQFLEAEAMQIYAATSLGLISDLSQVTPAEFLLGHFKSEQQTSETIKAQCEYTGNIMAHKTAEILAKMFGSKKK